MSYTPGPWEVEDSKVKTAILAGLKHIAMVNWYNSYNEDERIIGKEHKTNARLIAAAPDLLETLELAENAIQASYMQANVEWRRHDSTEDRCEKIISNFRKNRDAIIKKIYNE